MDSFSNISWMEFSRIYTQSIIEEINKKGKDYILKVDENEYINYIIENYRLEPLKILLDTEEVSNPINSQEIQRDMFGREFMTNFWTFRITYHFEGSADLFAVKPNPYTYSSYDIDVNSSYKTVSFQIKIFKQDAVEFKKVRASCYCEAFTNLNAVNENVIQSNVTFEDNIRTIFLHEKNKYKEENDFYAAINVKINADTQSIFSAPTIKKKIIKQPIVSKNTEFNSVPSMSKEMYDDVLKVVYDSGKSMEKKPALYIGKNEEGLRDQFLFILETRYTGATATGETFNSGGKADIVLKYADDGTNLYIAECKFWHGSSEFLKAISQLFDRYLTWRDSKVAVIIFVENKDFTNVLNIIKTDIINHDYYSRYIGDNGESSFSYEFHLPQDKDKKVNLEIITFHFYKK
ncbi:hypothetical protein [Gelidibacter gilvus]|uniref:Uncharacterized protein n=1 Tax=Gelidibacter gilvus TaxID=59602 RepID=A0A4Q0XG65_9FLAO|nr:hypothetical protein [Gelidibacter gilvus]RXJ45706.1 hypothetical protein ESZ48_15030 [Gelidibacter gilvus]